MWVLLGIGAVLALVSFAVSRSCAPAETPDSPDSEGVLSPERVHPGPEDYRYESGTADRPEGEPDGPPAEPVSEEKETPGRARPDDDRALSPPAQERVERQARRSPHEVPEALMEFATRMARRMEDARRSPAAGEAVFEELENCVREETSDSVRGICLVNAGRLAEVYPSLEGAYRRLKEAAPPELLELAE